jgi:hypothetical protein
MEAACAWELNRRTGHEYELLAPEAAIVMRATFTRDSPAVLVFFEALVHVLTGKGRKQ